VTPEVWRAIPSAPGYEASSAGRIRNTGTGHVLRPQAHPRGYLQVNLGRTRRNQLVHRLVCEAFHGAPALPSHHADHLNFDRTDNRPSNLRWLAAHLNQGRQIRWGRRGWEVEDPDVPEDHTPMTDDERARLDQALAAAGW
jgi:hypothetical protein